MKNLKRALRRHHRDRLLQKRKHYWSYNNAYNDTLNVEIPHSVINTPTPCSCYMCGNPRKYFKEASLEERRYSLMNELALV